MNYLSGLFVVAVTFASINASAQLAPDSIVKLRVGVIMATPSQKKAARSNKAQDIQKVRDYNAIITLTNTQDTSIKIYTWTCSWAMSFITSDRERLQFANVHRICDRNFPIDITIFPHDSIYFYARLCYVGENNNTYRLAPFKIGFLNYSGAELANRKSVDLTIPREINLERRRTAGAKDQAMHEPLKSLTHADNRS